MMSNNSESATIGCGNFDEQSGGWRKGPWTPEEDTLLSHYINTHGDGRWSSVSRSSGLNRSGKSCRLRWVNYLRPGLKKSQLTPQEEGIIIELHAIWGNKWSTIARYLPGRTDNEIKNYWRTHFKKKPKISPAQERRRNGIMNQQEQLYETKIGTEIAEMEVPREEFNAVSSQMSVDQVKQAMNCTFAAIEEQQPCWPIGNQQDVLECWSDMILDDGLWGSSWYNETQNNNCRQLGDQGNAYFCGGAETNNMFNGGNIF